MLLDELVHSVDPHQPVKLNEFIVSRRGFDDAIGWPCFSQAGKLFGLQIREVQEKKYRWFQMPGCGHLPIIYATRDDYNILYESGKVILTEGIFDRIAIKRLFPMRAVMARLSKGVGNQLELFLRRYANQVITAFDTDEAGLKATDKTSKRLIEGPEVCKLSFPYKDPASALEQLGPATLKKLLARQLTALDC